MATSIVIHLKTCTPVGHDAGIDRWPEGFGIDIFLRRSHVSVPPRLEVLPLSLSLSWFVPIFLNSIAVPWVYKCIVGFIPPQKLTFQRFAGTRLSRLWRQDSQNLMSSSPSSTGRQLCLHHTCSPSGERGGRGRGNARPRGEQVHSARNREQSESNLIHSSMWAC